MEAFQSCTFKAGYSYMQSTHFNLSQYREQSFDSQRNGSQVQVLADFQHPTNYIIIKAKQRNCQQPFLHTGRVTRIRHMKNKKIYCNLTKWKSCTVGATFLLQFVFLWDRSLCCRVWRTLLSLRYWGFISNIWIVNICCISVNMHYMCDLYMQEDGEESKPEKPNLTCAAKARSHRSVAGVSIALLQLFYCSWT